ncbi:MAG: outer membrane protein assembly factor BamE [Rickettsiales bacterium]
MFKLFFLIFVSLCCNSCIKTFHTSGHLYNDNEIEVIKNATTKQDIENLLGSPTTISDFGQETWYYITSKKERIAFLPESVVEQHIVVITFNKDEVKTIATYTEKDANKLISTSEYTQVKGNDITTSQQLFGNMGKFNSSKATEPAKPRSGF